MSRRAARVDDNHGLIADAFRVAGCSVQSLAEIGKGCPDLLVAINGHSFCVEVKDGSKPASERQLTPMQKQWHREFKGTAHIVETVEQAAMISDMWRKRRVG